MTRREVVTSIRPPRRARDWRPAALLALDLSVYAALWTALLVATNPWAKAVLAALAGLAIARLFLIGHDACHGSFFTGPRWANAIAARLVFLPSLTPYSTWELGHNTLHHGFTNLRGKDYVYTPFTKEEFDALPLFRRLLERLYRHPFGPGVHYAIEVWWKRLWFPRAPYAGPRRAAYLADSLLTLLFLVAQGAVTFAVSRATAQHPAVLVAWAVAAPFAVWNCVMGFVTYQQHTHPRIVWYADRQHWDPVTAQLQGTVHVVFPEPFGLLLGNIMEHTAHHLDSGIPLFDLPKAQRRVESRFTQAVTTVRWTWRYYVDCCRQCKLYDYSQRVWTGFDGV